MEYKDILPGITYEHEGYTVGIVLSQGTIIVAADQKDDCVPIEIIVTKK
ncbi:MAG: hypothetical protein U0L88_08245 [Acutalibacteraceae bacterium]|nr:hypothetical protein [Acutalibacteraceae bacterium]